ncbi:MAG: hypothetical protein LDL56_00595 [Armatimonadetes bacterium]|nr:hypothetical protein [Armatimonadota bacterium]
METAIALNEQEQRDLGMAQVAYAFNYLAIDGIVAASLDDAYDSDGDYTSSTLKAVLMGYLLGMRDVMKAVLPEGLPAEAFPGVTSAMVKTIFTTDWDYTAAFGMFNGEMQ